jgi:hypothetical protein
MSIIPRIADAMQTVLTDVADSVARPTGFIKRQRELRGSSFVQTLVFGWLDNPNATLEELTHTAKSLGVKVSPQGLDQRFTYEASECLKQTLEGALDMLVSSEPVAIPLLQRFNGVYIQDSSVIGLPDELVEIWAGCGGASRNSSSSLKIQVRLDMNAGKLEGPYLESGKSNDHSSCLQKQNPPKGSLRITDLGYFSLEKLSEMKSQGVYWLTRLNTHCIVYDSDDRGWDVLDLLETYCNDDTHEELEMFVLLGVKERIPCRLLAFRVPKEIVAHRRGKMKAEARHKGRKLSKRQLALAKWNVYMTSAPPELLKLHEAFVLMKIRWQIELLFKLWKDQGGIDESRSEKPWRILCEVYAKLLAMVIQHWLLLTGCWGSPDRSLHKGAQVIRKHATYLAITFASGLRERLYEALELIQYCLSSGCRLNKRKKKPNTYQLLLQATDSP